MLAWIYKHRIRIILNLIAWGLILNASYHNMLRYQPEPGMERAFLWHAVLYNLLFISASSINTFWLMPAYFVTRRYRVYFPALLALVVTSTMVVSRYNVWILQHFKGAIDGDLSSIAVSMRGRHMSWSDYYLNVFPAIFLVLLMFAIGFLMQQYFRVRVQQEAIGRQQMASELSLLKSQVNPHFLFNVLNSIYALSLKKSDQTPAVVLQLSDILRYMLYETKQEKVPLAKELEMIENYLDIERIRIEQHQQITLNVVTDSEACVIAPMLLLPFVENTVKHGIDSMSEHAFAHIDIEVKQCVLRFYSRNNFKTGGPERAGGIGLENVRKRLALLYPGKHELDIRNENTIFTVTLNLILN